MATHCVLLSFMDLAAIADLLCSPYTPSARKEVLGQAAGMPENGDALRQLTFRGRTILKLRTLPAFHTARIVAYSFTDLGRCTPTISCSSLEKEKAILSLRSSSSRYETRSKGAPSNDGANTTATAKIKEQTPGQQTQWKVPEINLGLRTRVWLSSYLALKPGNKRQRGVVQSLLIGVQDRVQRAG